MDQKISQMPAAAEVFNVDFFPIVQGAANFKATKELFLTSATGEDVGFTGGASFVGVNPLGQVRIDIGPTADFTMNLPAGGTFTISTINEVVWDGVIRFRVVNSFGIMLDIDDLGLAFVFYSGGIMSDWVGAQPSNLAAAITRIAAQMSALFGPIP